MTLATVEVVILNRPYFSPSHLLLADVDGKAVGFLHWLPLPEDSNQAVIANLAVIRHSSEDAIAEALIDAAIHHAQNMGIQRVLLGQAPEHWTGYAGVGRYGLGGGIPENEKKAIHWAEACRFSPSRQLTTFKLDLLGYRPAFDRDLLAMRRTSKIERRRDVTDHPYRISAALSHMETQQFVAISQTGRPMARATLLLGDPEMMIVSGKAAILTSWGAETSTTLSAASSLRFVISAAVSELIAERLESLLVTVEANDHPAEELLQSLGFAVEQKGTIFSRDLACD